jgi:hypothetical protein
MMVIQLAAVYQAVCESLSLIAWIAMTKANSNWQD